MVTPPENRLAVGRDNAGRFAKGVTGNPGGRPRGLAAYVRSLTDDGEALVDKVLYILEHPKGKGIQAQRLQLEWIQWLADRGFGKAVLGVVHAGKTAPWVLEKAAHELYDDWSTEDLKAFLEEERRARAFQEAKALREAKVIEGESHPVDVLESDPDAGDEAT